MENIDLNGLTPQALAEVFEFIKHQKETKSVQKDETDWDSAVAAWLDSFRSPETRRKYSRCLERFVTHVNARRAKEGLGPVQVVGDATSADARAYEDYLVENYASTKTRRNYFWSVASFFTFQKKHTTFENTISPFAGLKQPRRGKAKMRKQHNVLSKREVDLIIKNARTPKAKAFLSLMYFFALRNTEAAKIRGEHLSLEFDEEGTQYLLLRGLKCKGGKVIGEGSMHERKVYQKRALDAIAPYAGTYGYIFEGKVDGHIDSKTSFLWTKAAAVAAKVRLTEPKEYVVLSDAEAGEDFSVAKLVSCSMPINDVLELEVGSQQGTVMMRDFAVKKGYIFEGSGRTYVALTGADVSADFEVAQVIDQEEVIGQVSGLSRGTHGGVVKKAGSAVREGDILITKVSSHVSPHWFRHACASAWLHGGADILTISKFVGHSNSTITEMYLHADAEKCRTMNY